MVGHKHWGLGLMLALLGGCADDDSMATPSDGSTGGTATGADSGSEDTGLDESGDEPKVNPFQEVVDRGLADYLGTAPPSETTEADGYTQYSFDPADGPTCLRGEPFRMATRPGTTEGGELVIYLQGGGACWSGLCQAFETAGEGVPSAGLLNPDLGPNPVATWNVGYIPYCDGALFAGDIDIDDDDDGAIDRYHRGLQNLSAALDVIAQTYPEPSRILVAGTSAGAYGTIVGAMLVRTVYLDPPIDVLADAGIGLGKPGDDPFITSLLDEWNISRLLPDSCDPCVSDGHITPLVGWALDRDPDMRYAAISSYEDFVIGSVFLGIGGAAYGGVVAEQTQALEQAHPGQYHRYLFGGTRHTTIAIDSTTDLSGADGSLPLDGVDPTTLEDLLGRFDSTQVQGTTVADWTSAWLGAAEDLESVVEPME